MNTFPIKIHTSNPSWVRITLRLSGIKVVVSAIDHVVAHVVAATRDNAVTKVLSLLGAF